MAEIKSGNRFGTSPLGDRHDDRIDQSQAERPILLADRVGTNGVFLLAILHYERAFCDVGQERLLRPRTQLRAHQVVDFGQDCPRQDPLVWAILVQLADGCVMAISLVEQREDRACVGVSARYATGSRYTVVFCIWLPYMVTLAPVRKIP